MRNLKRALSLTLASVMLLGMMIVGTSALSFNDADDISNVTAATVLEELGVMQGDGKGNFMPDQTVTRGQMAILICKMLYGDKLNVSQFTGSTSFNDVPANAYYTGYVNLATQLGIISGYGDGNFGPGDPITTAQAALMLSRALGWFQAGELSGQGWANNALTAMAKATQINLFGDLRLETNTALSRDNVAEMVFNSMTKTTPVMYNETWNVYYTDSSNVLNGTKFNYRNTLGYENYDLVYRTAYDDFGQPSTEWGTGTVTQLDDKGDIDSATIRTSFIKSADAADLTYLKEVKVEDIYKDLGLTETKASSIVKFIIDGKTEDETDGGKIKSNNEIDGVKVELDTVGIVKTGANKDVKIGGKGAVVNVYYDNDRLIKNPDTGAISGDVVIVSVTNYYLAKALKDYDTKDEEVDLDVKGSGLGTITVKNEDVAVSGVKRDDYLVVTVSNGSVKTASPAQIVENVVVSAARKEDYVTAGGSKYEYSDIAEKDSQAIGYDLMSDAGGYELNGGGYNLYLDPNGYVLGVEGYNGGVNMSSYVFIDSVSNTGFDVIAKGIFSDGTKKTITIDKKDGNDVDVPGDVTAKQFYKFTTSGDNYRLTSVTSSASVGGQTAKVLQYLAGTTTSGKALKDTVNPIDGNSTQFADSTTIFVAKDQQYIGVKNAPKVPVGSGSTQNVIYYLYGNDTNTTNRLLWVYATNTGSVTVNVEDLIYIIDAKAGVAEDNGTTYYQYKAWKNGEEILLDANDEGKPCGLYEVKTYTDGRADLDTPITANVANKYIVKNGVGSYSYRNSILTVGGTAYELADNVKVWSVDGTTVKSLAASSLTNETATRDGFTQAILIREKDDADADVVVIYVVKPTAAAPAEIPSTSTSTEINNTMNGSGTDFTTPSTNLNGVSVPNNKNLTVTGGVTGTASVTVGTGSSLTVSGGAVSGALTTGGTGNVTLDGVAVNANVTSNTAAKTTLKGVNIGSSSAANVTVGNTTIEGSNTLGANATLTIKAGSTVTVASGASITAVENAKVIVEEGADATALYTVANLKFYTSDSEEIIITEGRSAVEKAKLPSGTYTYKANAGGENKPGWQINKTAEQLNAAATVTSVTVSPSTATVAKGGTQKFTATVTGTNDPDTSVTWSVTDNAKSGTSIAADGTLTVAADETATSITVTATSTADETKTGTATVTVGDGATPAHTHSLEWSEEVAKVEATCTTAGAPAHYTVTCSGAGDCDLTEGAWYATKGSDTEASAPMTDEQKVIAALGHDYEAGSGANEGKCVCKNDSSHTHDTYDGTGSSNKPGQAGCSVCETAGMPTT